MISCRLLSAVLLAMHLVVAGTSGTWAAERTSSRAKAAGGPVATSESTHPPTAALAGEAASDAERIGRLDRSLRSDAERLDELKVELAHPDGEYAEAEADFNELDTQLSEKKQQLDSRVANGGKADRKLQNELGALQKQWTIARDRFELAVRQRKAVQESIAALQEKIDHDRQALDELRGLNKPEGEPAPTAPGDVLPASSSTVESPSSSPGLLVPSAKTGGNPAPKAEPPPSDPKAVSAELAAELATAAAAAQARQAAAQAAEREAHSISERIEILRKNIELARQLRETARKKVDNADAALKELSDDLFRKMLEGANTADLQQKIGEATNRVREARDESRQAGEQLDAEQSTLTALQTEQLAANRDADQKRDAAAQAAAAVKELNNPFTVHRLLQWALDHGPKILGMLLAMFVCIRVSRIVEARLVTLIARRAAIGNREERENRAKTLLGIFHNAANIVILGGGVVAVLDELGIPVAPLVGGAAVIGLAVAFGAQSLIKDYFTGFLVLLEHQYLVNDVVKIGAITGQVERITLRTTMLRDGEGHVHFIPHGQITTVTNTTHGWSRAVFEIHIGYRENIDRVRALLVELGKELRGDAEYSGMILDDLVMLGVEALADSHVLLKFHIKTRPLQQSTVRRELLRRIKNRFDELGIEIPTPQLTIHRADRETVGMADQPRKRRAG